MSPNATSEGYSATKLRPDSPSLSSWNMSVSNPSAIFTVHHPFSTRRTSLLTTMSSNPSVRNMYKALYPETPNFIQMNASRQKPSNVTIGTLSTGGAVDTADSTSRTGGAPISMALLLGSGGAVTFRPHFATTLAPYGTTLASTILARSLHQSHCWHHQSDQSTYPLCLAATVD